jgi:RepB DNA-primase from phage plasmid
MQHKRPIDTRIVAGAGFLTRSFGSDEMIAIVLRRVSPPTIVQRIVTIERVLQPRYLGWLTHENAIGANVYVAANPMAPGSRKRTKECIAEVRHLYLDLDTDADAKLTALRASNVVPIPSAIVGTSAGKYQVLWRVEHFPFEHQETLLKVLASTFGGDAACTDLNRVLRVPGFVNQKYTPAPVVTVEYPSNSTWHSQDFQLTDPEPNRQLIRPLIGHPNVPGKHSHSEQDWTWILGELARGKDPVKLTRTLTERRPDKPNPVYYAQRTVDVASAWLWLRDGVPMGDVITMLQVRRRFQIRDKLCSARAHEIAFTAQRMIARKKIA